MIRIAFLLCSCILSMPVLAGDGWFSGWRQTEMMRTARAGAAAVAYREHIYVLGGVDGRDFLNTVEWSRVQRDGRVEKWRSGTAMLTARGFFAAAVVDGWIYAVGGGNGPHGKHLLASVERAPILADGSIGLWREETYTLSQPRRCAKVEVMNGFLYALGGFNGHLLDTVERARLLPDGGLGPWQVIPQRMTVPRYIHTAERVDGVIYVLGGHNEREGTGLRAVEVLSTGPGGRFTGEWQSRAAMNQGRYGLASAHDRGFLFALGGLDGARYSDAVERSRITSPGRLVGWKHMEPLSSPRANLSTLVIGHRLYVIGGTNRDGYFRTVEYAYIRSDGELGIFATDEERKQYLSRKTALKSAQKLKSLPRSGRVGDVIQTRAYTYIRVDESGNQIWVAAPKMSARQGQRLQFSRGLLMESFHSNSLNRDFAEILFVEKARIQ